MHFDNFRTGRTFANQDQAKTAFVNFIKFQAPNFYADLCYVGKSALIRMGLISIKMNKYSMRYYSLK